MQQDYQPINPYPEPKPKGRQDWIKRKGTGNDLPKNNRAMGRFDHARDLLLQGIVRCKCTTNSCWKTSVVWRPTTTNCGGTNPFTQREIVHYR
jgi:hypothetical protein